VLAGALTLRFDQGLEAFGHPSIREFLACCIALALTSILAILGTVPLHGEEGVQPGIADRCSGGNCASRPVRGVTVYRGLVLDYEVIDGLAVHGGDMVLGTAEEAAAAAPSREPAKREASPGPVRRDLFPIIDSLQARQRLFELSW